MCVCCFYLGKAGLPDPELLVERLLKRRTFRADPQGTNIMFAFFAQHFTHQFFKTYNRMGPGFTKALAHGVSFYAASFYDFCFIVVTSLIDFCNTCRWMQDTFTVTT